MDDVERGVFATRAPSRPNSIGISVVKLNKIEYNILHIENIDIIDGTPLLDIKPYLPDFDSETEIKKGWLESKINKLPSAKDDGRFKK
jgi:tRNA-Thr(GGU) m(6)t(6)A37 methyltransferase TsaA